MKEIFVGDLEDTLLNVVINRPLSTYCVWRAEKTFVFVLYDFSPPIPRFYSVSGHSLILFWHGNHNKLQI